MLIFTDTNDHYSCGGSSRTGGASRYRPQIAAYWKAVTEMTGITVDARIYSTSTGQFVEYDHGELVTKWERLRKVSQPALAANIAMGGTPI